MERRAPQGLDAGDKVALGLSATHLVYLVVFSMCAWGVASSDLPSILRVPLATLIAALGAALAWGRVAGRPLDRWVLLYFGYLWRARRSPAAAAPVVAITPQRGNRGSVDEGEPQAVDPPPGASVAGAEREFGRARRLVFFSFRGGTGKTTLAVEVAALLKTQVGASPRSRVALLDCDRRASALRIRLGLIGPDSPTDREARLPAAEVERHLLRHHSGLRVMVPARTSGFPSPGSSGLFLDSVLSHLDREGYDAVVIDAGSSLDALTEAVMDAADDIIYVFSTDASGIYDLYQGIAALRRLGHREKLRCVANRCARDVALDEMLGDLRIPLLGRVPSLDVVGAAEDQHSAGCFDDESVSRALQPLLELIPSPGASARAWLARSGAGRFHEGAQAGGVLAAR